MTGSFCFEMCFAAGTTYPHIDCKTIYNRLRAMEASGMGEQHKPRKELELLINTKDTSSRAAKGGGGGGGVVYWIERTSTHDPRSKKRRLR